MSRLKSSQWLGPVLGLAMVLAGPVVPTRAQSEEGVQFDAHRQVFAVLCALRAGAPELARSWDAPTPVSTQVDEYLATLDASVTEPVRAYLTGIGFRGTGEELSAFISTGLLLTPEFGFWLPEKQLPPDAALYADFVPVLREFDRQAGLNRLFGSVVRNYLAALDGIRGEVAERFLQVRGTLRLIGTGSAPSSYRVIPEWLVPRWLASSRTYGNEYFVVVHPLREDFADFIQHQYLHYLLDAMLAEQSERMDQFVAVADRLVDRIPRLTDAQRRDALLLIGESFVQAVELRLLSPGAEELEAEFDRREGDGILFVRYFFDRLVEFEKDEVSLGLYLPEFFRAYRAEPELVRLSKRTYPAPEPNRIAPVHARPAEPATPDPVETILREAQQKMRDGEFVAAHRLFERVLLEHNSEDSRALYGLGLVASAVGDRGSAVQYFEGALRSARTATIRTWSNIYLGRIFDLEGKREQAVEHYRSALETSSGDSRAEEAARRGLQQPFGQEPR